MASKGFVGLAAAGVGAAIGIALGVGIFRDTATNTNVILGTSNSERPCVVVSKENVVIGKVGRKVKWWVRDFSCGRPGEVVRIGNFRTSGQSSSDNCQNATQDGAPWPFEAGSESQHRTANPGGKIDLKLKNDQSLPPYYDFDICTGTGNAETKADPRLVIDR